MVKILAFDPGTLACGYALWHDGAIVAADTIRLPRKAGYDTRLAMLYQRITELVKDLMPDALAVEQPHVAKSVSSAFAIAQAQGAVIIAGGGNLPIHKIAPTTAKKALTGHGQSSKQAMADAAYATYGINVQGAYDTSDAIAVAHAASKLYEAC